MLHEELLTAVLHKVGPDVRMNDKAVTQVIGEIAAKKEGLLDGFAVHPTYKYSPKLEDCVTNLTHGGSIIREGITSYFRSSPHTAGPYGKSLYEQLDESGRAIIDDAAQKIRQACSEKN